MAQEHDERYSDLSRPALLTGPEALVRMVLAQRRRDARRGLDTAGFVSGYRGSPVGYVDQAFWEAKPWLEAEHIVFQPGINEDLAATAVWGTQQLDVIGDATVEGVFGLWYGKGPGVDRSGDAFKHGNYTGSHPKGGVLVLLGDDHPGKSSTVAHHSEQAMAAHHMPVLYPSNLDEVIAFGQLGWMISRYAGCWVAMKLVNETVEQTATVRAVDIGDFVEPDRGELPPGGLHYRGGFEPQRDEMIHKRFRLPLAQRFCRANRIDRAEFGVGEKRIGIVTAGKSYGDVMQALGYLGVNEAGRARELGLDVWKVGMIWPLEPAGLREFAAGCEELLFIEEKSAFLEPQAAALLVNDARRPRIVGKQDEQGAPLLASDLQLQPVELAGLIAARMQRAGRADEALLRRLDTLKALVRSNAVMLVEGLPSRSPYFCSGCPHSRSTKLPQGSIAYWGIGCHSMAAWTDAGTGNTLVGTHMGAEGAHWAGLHHFTTRPHIFQNLGDGTYYHSGILGIRQAIASGANITYKVLYNDAVAMTGGQAVDGPLTPLGVVKQLHAEGIRRIALISEDTSRYTLASLPEGVTLHEREALEQLQCEFREIPGCTAILYDQTCAAEKRRRRKRHEMPDPKRRVVINEEVCEGCGDCSVQSGCMSIEPLETALGAKRRINQSSCNMDTACLEGFCPSLVTVEGVTPRRRETQPLPADLFARLPEPAPASASERPYGVMLAGIGGSGVITVSAVIAKAAQMQGLHATVYDMTGMSQKNGAVLSHLKIAAGQPITAPVLGVGEANLLLAFDLVAAVTPDAIRSAKEGSQVLGNEHVQPTGPAKNETAGRADGSLVTRRLQARVGAGNLHLVDATSIARELCGDEIGSNFFLVGVAVQQGWLPVAPQRLLDALAASRVQAELNRRAFQLGRLWAHNPRAVLELMQRLATAVQSVPMDLDSLVRDRAERLVAYQGGRYAARFRDGIDAVRAAEARLTSGIELSSAAARALYRLMAYKDEYEVARLHADPAFRRRIAAEFEGTPDIHFHLAPPVLARRDAVTGLPRKQRFGPWVMGAFGLLARMKFLRGTVLDPFGHTQERRLERALVRRYEALLAEIASGLTGENHGKALALASLPLEIRGFGHVKLTAIEAFEAKLRVALTQFRGVAPGVEQQVPPPGLAAAA